MKEEKNNGRGTQIQEMFQTDPGLNNHNSCFAKSHHIHTHSSWSDKLK